MVSTRLSVPLIPIYASAAYMSSPGVELYRHGPLVGWGARYGVWNLLLLAAGLERRIEKR